jgi:CRISPR-associated endonuclease/helicase Cas3
MRVLVEQTFRVTEKWLKAVGLEDKIDLSLLMGGEDPRDWHMHPEREAVLIGTQDMLLSRGLNRGYAASRYRWPVEFGLLSHDCLWVFDEVQLMGGGLATSAQMEAFRHLLGTFIECRSIWMSATIMPEWLATVDFRDSVKTLVRRGIDDADRNGALKTRLEAPKKLIACDAPSEDHQTLADFVLESHKPGARTLVVLNTVKRAVDLYTILKKSLQKSGKRLQGHEAADAASPADPAKLILLHSRFRPTEKQEKINSLLDGDIPPGGVIAVTTQVVEAGVDISAQTMFTDLAPWPSLVQRFGRCNRKGEHAEAIVHWIDVLLDKDGKDLTDKKRVEAALPYDADELTAARERLQILENVSINSLEKHLASMSKTEIDRLFPYVPQHVIRKKDLVELFDTTPDLAGNDVDVSRFIRDGDDQDVQVLWRDVQDNGPAPDEKAPARDELCSVQTGRFIQFLKSKSAYRWDHLEKRWVRAIPDDVIPGRTFLIPSSAGGYDPDIGWSHTSKAEVEVVSDPHAPLSAPEANDDDLNASMTRWELMSEHADRTVQELESILSALAIQFPCEVEDALKRAARLHDWGKFHEVFVNAFSSPPPDPGLAWAKAPSMKQYERRGFRHELAGALAMLQSGEPSLACYLVAAHHGKVRLSIRSLPTEQRPLDASIRYARGIRDGDVLEPVDLGAGVTTQQTTLSLEPMELGMSADGEPSWAARVLELRDDPDLGPFRIAFLEALLRAADVRASIAGAQAVSVHTGGQKHD